MSSRIWRITAFPTTLPNLIQRATITIVWLWKFAVLMSLAKTIPVNWQIQQIYTEDAPFPPLLHLVAMGHLFLIVVTRGSHYAATSEQKQACLTSQHTLKFGHFVAFRYLADLLRSCLLLLAQPTYRLDSSGFVSTSQEMTFMRLDIAVFRHGFQGVGSCSGQLCEGRPCMYPAVFCTREASKDSCHFTHMSPTAASGIQCLFEEHWQPVH